MLCRVRNISTEKKSTIHAAEIRTQDLLDTSQTLLDPCQWGGSKLHKQHCLESENHAVGIQLRPLDNAAYVSLPSAPLPGVQVA